ncbi:MAG: protein phosphatase 2C domain-containing protein [bacterium]
MPRKTEMTPTAPLTVPAALARDDRPRDDELDLFGITHAGLVRADNQDHFLLCTVHPQVVVHATSLPPSAEFAPLGQRLATLMLVADGVGGSAAGSRASRIATEAVTRYVASSLRCYQSSGTASEGEFEATLLAAAIEAHHAVRSEAEAEPDEAGMATTLSLGIVIWPWMYVVQVGDSRCYLFHDGVLRQLTRDQTFAQELIEQGVFTREDAKASPLNHILSSALGASEALPEVTRVDVRTRGCVIFVCTDGLTKHVSDAEIGEHLASMVSAEQVCHTLLDLALSRGGSDNITLVAGRALVRRDS